MSILIQYSPTLYPNWDKFVELIRSNHALELWKQPIQIVDLNGKPLVMLARKLSLAWFKQLFTGVSLPGDR